MSEDPADRRAFERLREVFRKNTLSKHNQCWFDLTEEEKKKAALQKLSRPK